MPTASEPHFDDGTAAGISDERDDVRVNYGGGWVQSIVGSMVVGLMLLGATRCSSSDVETDKAVTDLRVEFKGVTTELAGVKSQLQQLVNQPYERQEDHARDIARFEQRLNDVERSIERRNR
jgi:hypothetical protein